MKRQLPPGRLQTRDKLVNKTLAEVKAHTDSQLGQANGEPIAGHAAGTLTAVAARVDGNPERWRIFFEWEQR